MNAIDTNILARYFVTDVDDAEAIKQQKIAIELLRKPSYVSLSVVLEFFWVMKRIYALPKQSIAEVIRHLCDTPHIEVEHSEHILTAIEHFLQGMDFADALHVAQVAHCQQFYTFDKRFIKKAQKLNIRPSVIEPV